MRGRGGAGPESLMGQQDRDHMCGQITSSHPGLWLPETEGTV